MRAKTPSRFFRRRRSFAFAEPLEPRRLLSAVRFDAIDQFTANSTVSTFAQFQGQGYFGAGPSAGNYALYRTDMTLDGTSAVLGGFTTIPSSITPLNDELLFVADDAAHGTEIWLSDGTAAGTSPVTSFADPNVSIDLMTAGPNGQLAFFRLQDPASGIEL